MEHFRRISAAVLMLVGAVLALAAAPAAFAKPLPPPDCCDSSGAQAQLPVISGVACPAGRSP